MTNRYVLMTGQTGYPQPEDDDLWYENTYDTRNSCPTCHVGKTQKAEFLFKGEPKSKNSAFIGLNWVFDVVFIRNYVKEIFEKEKITGISFSRPLNLKTKKPLETIWQIHVENIVNNNVIDENLKIEQCEMPKDEKMIKFLKAINSKLINGPFCNAKKYNIPTKGLIYSIDSFDDSIDFYRTKDWFGSGGNSNQLIVISEKVKNIITENRMRGAFLTEIELR